MKVFTALVLLVFFLLAGNLEAEVLKARTLVVPIKGEIGAAIRTEMEKSRRDGSYSVDVSGISARMEEAFPYLDDYLDETNDSVRQEIVSILSRESSERSLKLTARYMTPNSSAFDNGTRWIYQKYSAEQIDKWGGDDLQRALFLGTKVRPNPFAILLLSCFGNKATTQLKEIRTLHPNLKVSFDFEGWLSPTRVTLYCDLALTQIGDQATAQRLKERLALGSANDMAAILVSSKLLSEKLLISAMINALGDERVIRPYRHSAHSKAPIRYTRICDIAWGVLQFKTGESKWLDLNPGPQTDESLSTIAAEARRKFGT